MIFTGGRKIMLKKSCGKGGGTKVLAAMSGGVDSSVAALLLKEAGYDITGVTMSLGISRPDSCPGRFTDEAIEDAKLACEQMEIPHLVLDCARLLEEKVIDKFVDEYRLGRTPNPCVDCNRYLKFGLLLDKALGLGFEKLATGHYARIENTDNRWRLLRPLDKSKDQTYFLYTLRVADLPNILFPLGTLTKEDVRRRAAKSGLHGAHRIESQDICFVPQGDYSRVFTERKLKSPAGDIVDGRGMVLGRHRGIIHYTIGQRSGLGISAKFPLYVLRFDIPRNQIVVGNKKDLFSPGLIAGGLNILQMNFPAELEAKIRYRKKPARCRVLPEGEKLKVIFEETQESITPGQHVVFYDGDEVVAGGVIEDVLSDI